MTIAADARNAGSDLLWSRADLDATVRAQRTAFLAGPPASVHDRRDRLARLSAAVLSRTDDFVEAVNLDFGNRPRALTLAGEIAATAQDIADARMHVARWMRPRRPQPGYIRMAGIRAWVEPTPLGVVGVISPWNFPIVLAFGPTTAAIAAGNRVLLKMSENTPHTAEVMRQAVTAYFAPEELVVVTGGPDVGARFSELPLDHLFFTGAPGVGRLVAQAAAKNLVPVTLELGGKNPTVVGTDADLGWAAKRIARARLANGGQICLSPDYAFVPAAKLDDFQDHIVRAFRDTAPQVLGNDDYCAIINDHHYKRVTALVADAREKGARVVEVTPSGETFPAPHTRRIPPTVITGVTDDMHVMQEENFGPLLAILPYDTVDDVIDYVAARPHPLAVYWFGDDSTDYRRFKQRTRSGGITRNDFILHAGVVGLPFGGVGNSGSGYYHGQFGFDTFSHLRAVAEAPRAFTPSSPLSPPFSPTLTRTMGWALRRLGNLKARRLEGRR